MTKQNILFITQYYEPEPFIISEVAESLVAQGNNVTVLTGLPNYPEGKVYPGYHAGHFSEQGIQLIRLKIRPRKQGKVNLFLNYLSYAFQASRKVLTFGNEFDVVYVYQLSPILLAIPGIIYKSIHKKKLVLYCLDLWPQSLISGGIKPGSFVYNCFLGISRYIYRRADIVQISSKSFEKYFKKEIKKVKVLRYQPQFADDYFLQSLPDEKVEEDKTHTHILFAGNIGHLQSLETWIEAVALLKDSNLILDVVGDGSHFEAIKEKVQKYHLNDKVILHGRKPKSEMPIYYQQADALAVSLINDEVISYTLPGKVQTYMASKKPIIASINGEAADIIRTAECGLVSPAENAELLAENMRKFIEISQADKDRMADNGVDYYLKHFTKADFVRRLIEDLQ
ncbi:glycosyltransferase family 4 protein [Staphylococcus debuckii]|uniref:glycosyltransferase family 4 protein n=1 Tax=Staphylococcus debuckii TaxID=2044912 RepID=UPI000F42EAA3|nr:glycosyltransferase family 4 protein [Staphylococcus debuckii]AYU55009.1 glycosyltransferase WbuB [Staphylococcus debuckii]